LAYPVDGRAIGVNPPGFCWTPHDDAKRYRLEVRRAGASRVAVSAEPLTSTVYPPPQPFETGDYQWQVVYLTAEGKAYGASRTRRFTVRAGIPELPMPDSARLKRELAGVRPRLFLAGNRLEQAREAVKNGRIPQWDRTLQMANGALKEPLYPEPHGYPDGKFEVTEWRRIYTPAKAGSAHVARAALMYKITGDAKYLENARRWMLHLASWNPRGITSHDVPQPNGSQGNDEASMPILERVALGWDWVGDQLSAEERRRILASMTERGNQVLQLLQHNIDFLSHPFSNHEGRVLAFLGLAGISFLGDIPEAEQWLDYVIRCYLTSYPGWGSDEGGWAQGVGYWSSYVLWLSNFGDALRRVTDVDIFRRPFYRNTGYLSLYFHPHYARRSAFGDGGDRPPSEGERLLVDYFAETFKDPVLKWHATSITARERPGESSQRDQWMAGGIQDVFAALRFRTAQISPKPPAGLDGSRYLSDIGWAAMHSALGDAGNDVWALFKSSRFGSFSHSHADQNTFQLNAYGEPLLIDSGYYPWYGSPHDGLWTRQTWAHNGVLVNGRGQPPHRWEAGGEIEAFERHGSVTVVRGQAAGAYNVPQTDSILQRWKEHLREPVPPMTPKVESFRRTLAFVASKTRPVLVVHDFLRTDAPTTFDWLLHALEEMKSDERTGSIGVNSGNARLAVRLVSTEPFSFAQRTGFNVPPDERAANRPNQWHLKARTGKPAGQIKFLAVMVPYRASEKMPEIAPLKSGNAVGFEVDGAKIAAWWGPGEQGNISAAGLAGEGRMVVAITENGKTQTVVCK
jgi:hypothetical protein